ncbi:MAG: hypothetical protein EOP52_05815 [Sphingobacteriales bacterium]|nr:MAG: hypothetical protein EOP52_05815 [Sphingobacteriales bacterium]
MNLPSLILLFSGLSLAACSQTRSTTTKTSKPTSTSTAIAAPKVNSVKMSRGVCYGRCPVYDVEVMQTGMVRYTGRRFVKSEGIYEKTFNTASVATLLQQFTEARTDTMQNEYRQLVTDLPSITYELSYNNGTQKTIQNANYGPAALVELAASVDALVGEVNYTWKKTAATVE